MMRVCCLAVVLALWFTSCGAQMTWPSTASTGGTGPVTLLKSDGQPAAGATVIVRTFSGFSITPGSRPRLVTEKTYTADAQGMLAPDWAPVMGAAYQPYSSYALISAPGCCVTALPLGEFCGQITLLPEKTMIVTVTLNGKPAPGANIYLNSVVDIFHFNTPRCGVSTREFIFRTGPDGTARIPVINTGKFPTIATTQLAAFVTMTPDKGTAPSYCAFPVNITLSQRSTAFAVALQPAVTLTGTVTAPNGQPIAGAVVSHTGIPVPSAVTDVKGQYRLFGVPRRNQGTEVLEISHPDYGRAQITLDPQATTPSVTVLHPRVTVQGRVIDAVTGEPIRAVFTIRMSYCMTPDINQAILDAETFTTAADGTFSARIPARSALIAFAQGYDGGKFMIEKTFADRETVELKVQKGMSPRGMPRR